MPIYEYLCASCGHRFEELQNMGDKPVSVCPQCGGGVKKLMSTASPISSETQRSEKTCCGRQERCEKPPCADDGTCKR
ncbi:MAG: zinc ribbon domain-containing protein [Endomicrobiales bacterium]|nr:zinc ribbon domain-containing protein [Endomicrobiales bacterium]